MLEPASVYVDDHVHHGPSSVLPGYVPVVYHLEHSVQYWTVVYGRVIDLDALEGDLYTVMQADLCKDFGDGGHGDQVQAQGARLVDLECSYHLHVP